MHLTRQTDAVMMSVKKKRSAPVIIAPIKLVASKAINKRITAVNAVPKMPAVMRDKLEQTQSEEFLSLGDVNIKIARYTIAIPSAAHKKTGVKVITHVILRRAVIKPTIMPDMIAKSLQKLGQ